MMRINNLMIEKINTKNVKNIPTDAKCAYNDKESQLNRTRAQLVFHSFVYDFVM